MDILESIFGKGKTKSHEEFNEFIQKTFTTYINNSNLFSNFAKDFENRNNREKKYCDECNELYLLTNDIFEKYINKVKIPYNIKYYEKGYKNKILYFFNINDLNNVLEKEKLLKIETDKSKPNIKRFLCKIVSITFIKIYIIVKSIYETFNIYDPIYIKNFEVKKEIQNYQENDTLESKAETDEAKEPPPETDEATDSPPETDEATDSPPETDEATNSSPETDKAKDSPKDETIEPPPETDEAKDSPKDETIEPPPETDEAKDSPKDETIEPPPETDEAKDETIEPPPENDESNQDKDIEKEESKDKEDNDKSEEPNKIDQSLDMSKKQDDVIVGGGLLNKILPTVFGEEENEEKNPEETQIEEKLEESIELPIDEFTKNNFYSILFILLEIKNSADINELVLKEKIKNIDKNKFIKNLKKLMKYLCTFNFNKILKYVEEDNIIFNTDNFSYIKFKSNENKSAIDYLKEVDSSIEKNYEYTISDKKKKIDDLFNYQEVDKFNDYCKILQDKKLEDIFGNEKLLEEFKYTLTDMVDKYFSGRQKLYEKIIKNIFEIDESTNKLEKINNKLTYKKLVRLTQETKIKILEMKYNTYSNISYIITLLNDLFNIAEKNNGLIEDKEVDDELEKFRKSREQEESAFYKSEILEDDTGEDNEDSENEIEKLKKELKEKDQLISSLRNEMEEKTKDLESKIINLENKPDQEEKKLDEEENKPDQEEKKLDEEEKKLDEEEKKPDEEEKKPDEEEKEKETFLSKIMPTIPEMPKLNLFSNKEKEEKPEEEKPEEEKPEEEKPEQEKQVEENEKKNEEEKKKEGGTKKNKIKIKKNRSKKK